VYRTLWRKPAEVVDTNTIPGPTTLSAATPALAHRDNSLYPNAACNFIEVSQRNEAPFAVLLSADPFAERDRYKSRQERSRGPKDKITIRSGPLSS
jgi:hypothetical protein